jgi:hypothetical protein
MLGGAPRVFTPSLTLGLRERKDEGRVERHKDKIIIAQGRFRGGLETFQRW